MFQMPETDRLAQARQFVQQRLSDALWQMHGGGTAMDVREALQQARDALDGDCQLTNLASAYNLIEWTTDMVGRQVSYPPLEQAGRLVRDLLVLIACAKGVALDADCLHERLCDALGREVGAGEACRFSHAFAQIVLMGQVGAEPDRVHRVYGGTLPQGAAEEIRRACRACAAATPQYVSRQRASVQSGRRRDGRPPKPRKRAPQQQECSSTLPGMEAQARID